MVKPSFEAPFGGKMFILFEVNLNEQWKNCSFLVIVQGLFRPLVLLGLRYPTIFGESNVSKASGFVFLSPHKMLDMWMQIPSYTLQLGVICRVYLGEISLLQLYREAHYWRGHHALLEGCTCKPWNEQATPVESEGSWGFSTRNVIILVVTVTGCRSTPIDT